MKKNALSLVITVLVFISALSGCISGGDDNGEADTTAPPTTTNPTNTPTTAATTQPPTTPPATPSYVHNECSTTYMGQESGNARYYGCDISADPEELWSSDISRPLSYIMTDYDRAFYIEAVSGNYKLKCLDVDSGALYWETPLPYLRFYDLILQDGMLYVFEDGEKKALICYDSHDGSMLWTSEDVYGIYPDVGELMAVGLNCADGKIFVTLGGTGNDTVIYCCFNGADGEVLWHNAHEYDNSSRYPSIDGGTLYYSVARWGEDDQIIGIDTDTGDIEYVYSSQAYDNFNGRDIVVSNGRVYAMAQNMDTYRLCVVCISTLSNNIIWQYEIGDSWGNDIIVGEDHVFLAMPEKIICLGKGNGQEIWSTPMDYHAVNAPIATPGILLVFRSHYQTDILPQLLLIDVASGEEIWDYTFDGTYLQRGASFYEGKILIGTDNGKLYCFE